MLYASFIRTVKVSRVAGRSRMSLPGFRLDGHYWDTMLRIRSIWTISALIFCAALAGCGGINQFGSQTGNNGNSSVVLAMTDTPPSNVTILSAKVTLTGAKLIPGDVPLLSGSTTVEELTRLQTDIAYLATAHSIPAGNYTAVTLTFANLSLTIENDTGSVLAGCAIGSICTIAPAAPAMSTTIPLTAFSIAANSTTGLLIDVNLENLLTASLGADFSVGTTVTPFTPGGTGAPPVGAEDVVGQVSNINASSNTFTLTNAARSYPLMKVDNTTTFFQFPSGACMTAGFSCLHGNQILSVDIGIQPDGSILARNILFEDNDNSDTEVEGTITSTNAGLRQFTIVTLAESASVTGLQIGDTATVQYSTSPQTPFDVDFVHADNIQMSTSGFLFAVPADLAVGQQVSVRRNSSSSGNMITADRVRLRSSRITANVGQLGAPNIDLSSFPSIFSGHGVTQILAQTSASTIYFEIGSVINSSSVDLGDLISVRGPLFNASGTTRSLIATKVVLKQQ
jgi:hypothetical protein